MLNNKDSLDPLSLETLTTMCIYEHVGSSIYLIKLHDIHTHTHVNIYMI